MFHFCIWFGNQLYYVSLDQFSIETENKLLYLVWMSFFFNPGSNNTRPFENCPLVLIHLNRKKNNQNLIWITPRVLSPAKKLEVQPTQGFALPNKVGCFNMCRTQKKRQIWDVGLELEDHPS